MTSIEPIVGTKYFVPFWILLEFLDTAPPDPFIEVEILSIDHRFANSPVGPIGVRCCSLIIDNKQHLIANNIPVQYLIAKDDLKEWADKIANWFSSFRKEVF